MTTREENDLLTQTGPGKPGGNLLRRYWQPVALSRELADDTPKPVRVLGEDLVLFRDAQGRVGLVGKYCPHRCADLSYGRVEDGGLRCLYHGWLFDVAGRCLAQPAEPAESTYKDRIHHVAYPCREAAGAIFAYMGPGEPPLFPGFDFLKAPDTHVFQTKLYHECNYLQANEGNIDPAHLSFLHAFRKPDAARDKDSQQMQRVIFSNSRPVIDVERTRFGVRIFAERTTDDGRKYVRLTNFVFPNLGFFAGEGGRGGPGGYSVHWHVPIDDDTHWRYDFVYHGRVPLDMDALHARVAKEVDENFRPYRNKENRFNQDRKEMEDFSFSGLGTYFPAHDLYAVISPDAIHDRSRENLGTTDVAITMARRMLLDGIRQIAEDKEPPFVIRREDENVFNDIIVTGNFVSGDTDRRAYCAGLIEQGGFHALKA